MFKRFFSESGSDGPSVTTVLAAPTAHPGQYVNGWVNLRGGAREVVVDRVEVTLLVVAAVDHRRYRTEDYYYYRPWGGALQHSVVGRDFQVPADALVNIPFTFFLPWAAPVTAINEAVLPLKVGVRTDVWTREERWAGDFAPVMVQPLPSQNRVLDAFGELAATFIAANAWVETPGIPIELGLHQVFEFETPVWFSDRIKQVNLAFVVTRHDLVVGLFADRRGPFRRDLSSQFRMGHEDAARADWTDPIGSWLDEAASR